MSLEGIFNSPALQGLRMTMDEAALRHQAIASNIANVNTPGYKRVDVGSNFESAFNDAINRISQGESVSMDDMPDQTIETAANQGPARPDGNTVQVEQEMVSMAQNSARYEFAGQLLAQNFHGIKTAITGQS